MNSIPDPRRGVPSCSALWPLEACPASWGLTKRAQADGMVPPAGADAESGTRVHRWLETQDPDDWKRLTHDEQETAGRCCEQLERLIEDWGASESAAELPELRLGLTQLGTVVPVTAENTHVAFVATGMADIIIVDLERRRAMVVDYKAGRGEVAEATGNRQLMGLAALAGRHWHLDSVRVAIVQPLAGPPSVADYDGQSLANALVWLEMVVGNATEGTGEPVPGDHCHYCDALAICPAVRQKVTTAPDALEIETIAGDPEHVRSVLTARALDLPPAELAGLLRGRRMIGWYVSAIEAAARMRLERGEQVPGFELRERAGRRKITDASKAAEAVAPLLVNAEGGSAAALLRCAELRAKPLTDEVQRASGKKSQTRYNLTSKDAKAALESALNGLMICSKSMVLTEVGAAIEDGEGGDE